MNTNNVFMQASSNPVSDLQLVAYAGQDPKRRMYRSGYETFMNSMAILDPHDRNLSAKIAINSGLMKQLAEQLKQSDWIHTDNIPEPLGFARTIVAMEAPITQCNGRSGGSYVVKEGSELIVAQWGDGHTSPIHGHAAGFLHEEILLGKMRVNQYRKVGANLVRPVRTDIVEHGTFLSTYTHPSEGGGQRDGFVHNFTSLGYSATLHYVPEHTRDGRDNQFEVEYFDDVFTYMRGDLKRITSKEGLYSRIGDVILVRSENVPEYGDHYIVITGHPVVKTHGLRPQDVAIGAPTNKMLDHYPTQQGLTLLRLDEAARHAFLDFHGITVENGKVTFPQA